MARYARACENRGPHMSKEAKRRGQWRDWYAADGTLLLVCPFGTLGDLHMLGRQATWRQEIARVDRLDEK
jgi:hypothetical protein